MCQGACGSIFWVLWHCAARGWQILPCKAPGRRAHTEGNAALEPPVLARHRLNIYKKMHAKFREKVNSCLRPRPGRMQGNPHGNRHRGSLREQRTQHQEW